MLQDPGYRDWIFQRKDDLKNRGYDWRGRIFRKNTSPLLFADETKITNIVFIERLINYLIDHVKMIKKTIMWVYPKGYRDFN